MEKPNGSHANTLCKSCGLCCTGHLFVWTKLRSAELDPIENLGVHVLRSVPSQRGFNQPCPLWNGQCTIYTSPHYPRFCQTYKCDLLKSLLAENISLADALAEVQDAKELILDVEALLPDSSDPNFRERLAAQLEESSHETSEVREKGQALLAMYKDVFGVDDVIEPTDIPDR